jgi:hypothetical protein
MKPQRRRPIVPAYKARRRARERSLFMLDMVQARMDALREWIDSREPCEPGSRFLSFTTN